MLPAVQSKPRAGRLAWAAAALLAILLPAWKLLPRRPAEAAVAGRPLSAWLHDLHAAPERAARFEAAAAAFRAAGTNGVPLLRREFRRRPGLLTTLRLDARLPAPLAQPLWRRRQEVERRWRLAATLMQRAGLPARADAAAFRPLAAELVAARLAAGRAGCAVPELSRLLPAFEAEAVRALLPHVAGADAADAALAVEELRALLGRFNPEPELARAAAAQLVTWLERHSGAGGPPLAAALTALGCLGPAAGEAAAPVIRIVRRSADAAAVAAGCQALGRIARDGADAVPALRSALRHAAPEVRAAAAGALGWFGPRAVPAVPELAAVLADPAADVQVAAAAALTRLGPPAAAAAPGLLALTAAPLGTARAAAARALGRVQAAEPAVVARLAALLGDAEEHVRREAAAALGALGPAAAPAVEPLAAALRDAALPVRICAVEALGRIGPAARPAGARLLAARSNDQSGLGRQVLEALARLEGAASPAAGGGAAEGAASAGAGR
jgi:HEAT repeat protein